MSGRNCVICYSTRAMYVFPRKRGPITNKAPPRSLPPSTLPPTLVSERRITASNQGQARLQLQLKLKFRSSELKRGRIKDRRECRRLSRSRPDASSAPSRHLHQLKNISILIELETRCCWGILLRTEINLPPDENGGEDFTPDRFLSKLRLDVQGKREEERPTPDHPSDPMGEKEVFLMLVIITRKRAIR